MLDAKKRLLLAEWLWGWKPHETQRIWMLNDSPVKVAACGRRWGKTESAAVDVASTAITCPGSIQMIVSPTYDQSRLISDTVERLLLGSSLTRSVTKVVRTPYPKISVGRSVIMARTADEDGRNLRGHSAHRVIVDEAAYVRDRVIQEVIAPMLADIGGRLVMISTPFGKNHFYRAFVRGQMPENEPNHAQRIRSFRFPSWLNPHIRGDYIEAQRAELTPRQFAVEYEAQFLDDQSSVFAWDDIEAAASAYPDAPVCCEFSVAGIDWARYGDYTALVAVGVEDSMLVVTGIDRFNGMGWHRQIDRAVDFLRRHKVSAVLTDQTSVGDPLLEQLRAAVVEEGLEMRVEGLVFTNQSKRELIDELALRFARRKIAIPRNEELLRELQYFEYQLTDSGRVKLQAVAGCNDDLVAALALACWQAKQTGVATSCLTSGGRSTAASW
ncbi:MAG: terminase family protein [Armatimonadota bacterium]|nr:terminase family protein [Armatimonadota bacterium]